MEKSPREKHKYRNILIALILAAGTFLISVLIKNFRKKKTAGISPPVRKEILRKIKGLSEEQVEARKQPDVDNSLSFKPVRSRREIWRENVLSIFNLSLVGLALVQLLFAKPLDALLSLGVLALNIGVNVFQEYFARLRVKGLLQETRPRVTVIRDQAARSIDANDIVPGDMVAIGPGDELLADGTIVHQEEVVVDESMMGDGNRRSLKRQGEPVYAGSFCVAGRAVYQVEKIGVDRYIQELISKSGEARERLTPIERIINSVLRILLIVVAFFAVMLIYSYSNISLDIPVEFFNEVAGIIFSIAPAGLFFMVIVTYAASTVDLARVGALVHRARSVETMAQVNTICFSREGVLMSTKLDLSPTPQTGSERSVDQNRIQQILGDFVRSSGVGNQITDTIRDNFSGNSRETTDEAPYLSVHGWNAITFDDPDLSGTYVLGVPAALEPHLSQEIRGDQEAAEGEPSRVRKAAARLGSLFRRKEKDQSPAMENAGKELSEIQPQKAGLSENSSSEKGELQASSATPKRPGIFRRLLQRMSPPSKAGNDLDQDEGAGTEKVNPPIELIFAYFPDPCSLFDQHGKPRFPVPLTPLCRLTLTEQVRPEAVTVIKKFYEQGIGIKIFAAEHRSQIIELLMTAGLSDTSLSTITGEELAKLGEPGFAQAAVDNEVFLQLDPDQMGKIVAALRARGEYVAMVGDAVNDVPALRQANLAATYKSSSLAAQSVADILLLENSLGVLERVLDKGQRIVNGLLDILKLYLTQVFYLTFLITAIQIIGFGFPIRGIQLTVVTTVSITIPSIGLTLWANAGVLYGKSLRRSLFHFILPAAVTIAFAGTAVFFYFSSTSLNRDYTHLAITYYLVFTGLLVVLFLKPPFRIIAGGSAYNKDPRIFYLVVVLGILFFITVALSVGVPFLQDLLELDWLAGVQDYLVLGLVVFLWAAALQSTWRIWNMITITRDFRSELEPQQEITPPDSKRDSISPSTAHLE